MTATSIVVEVYATIKILDSRWQIRVSSDVALVTWGGREYHTTMLGVFLLSLPLFTLPSQKPEANSELFSQRFLGEKTASRGTEWAEGRDGV